MLFPVTVRPRPTILTGASLLLLLVELSSPLALPMTPRSKVDWINLSNRLEEIKTMPTGPPSFASSSSPSPAIAFSFTSSQPGSAHVLTSGSSYLCTCLTLSETFLLLFRRLHTLGFKNGILGCLAVFWAIVGFTIGILWGLSIYNQLLEVEGVREWKGRHDEGPTGDPKLSRRPIDRTLSPRSALSSPERRASYGMISPKSVRWAAQLTHDEPRRSPSPQYQEDRSLTLEALAIQAGDELDNGTYPSPSAGNKRRHSSTAYKSDRVRRVVAKLKAGGSNQLGFDTVNDVVLVLEGDIA